MKKLVLLGIGLMLMLETHAQIANLRGVQNTPLMEKKYSTVEGSPYLYQDWKTGTVTDSYGKKVDAALLKYDSYQDNIHIFKDGSTLLLSASDYPEFSLNFFEEGTTNKIDRYFKHNSILGLNGGEGYYEVLYEGQYKLLRKYRTDYINNVVSDYGTNKEVERFLTSDNLILVDPQGTMQEVKGGKGAIYDLFGSQSETVETIAKKARYNVKDEYDLILVLEKLDEIN